MTRAEAIEQLEKAYKECISLGQTCGKDSVFWKRAEAIKVAIKALEQEPKTEQFVEWVAREIFDEMWEYNKDSFAEIACRKLAKLGIVRAKGDEWELVEPQESEVIK